MQLTEIFRDAVMTGLKVGAPILLISILVGLFISIIQAATSIKEQNHDFVPKWCDAIVLSWREAGMASTVGGFCSSNVEFIAVTVIADGPFGAHQVYRRKG